MNILQSLPTKEPFCVSLNQQNIFDPKLIHGNFDFSHPTYHPGRKAAQNQAQFILLETKESLSVVLTGDMDSTKMG